MIAAAALYEHTDCGDLDLNWIRLKLPLSVALALPHPGTIEPLLPTLFEVEISLIDDETIAEVHAEFMDDPTATDVITFHHGEILVSADTARREAATHGNTATEETLLYIIHGLLHLNGHVDGEESCRVEMHRIQEEILNQLRENRVE